MSIFIYLSWFVSFWHEYFVTWTALKKLFELFKFKLILIVAGQIGFEYKLSLNSSRATQLVYFAVQLFFNKN